MTSSVRISTRRSSGRWRRKRIEFIPGSVELGDFDATSTTVALAPVGELAHLPRPALDSTFERYWREFEGRRSGTRPWDAYTPYELRTVGTMVRLGWRDRAHEAFGLVPRASPPGGMAPLGRGRLA